MANSRSSKRQLEKARQEKAAMKRERRQSRVPGDGVVGEDGEVPVTLPQEQVLASLAALHQAFASGTMSFETFEEEKAELMARLDLG